MRVGIFLSLSLLGFLAGCVTGGGVAPIEALRYGVMEDVNGYSNSFEAYLKSGKTKEEGLLAAQAQVASSLKDPGSAQFRNVEIKPYGYGKVVCGEVNAKNSYGGYVGFAKFVASHEASMLESRDSRYPAINNASNAGIYTACGQ